MASKKNVTFDDIAKYTHFSKTTISRYFNHPDSLTLENRKIIANALAALDYRENKVARILASGRTEFIGVIIPNLYLRYYSEVLDHILSTYETFGYKFLVFIGNGKEESERRYIQELLAYKIEGMIILSHTLPSKELAALQIPIVTIEREDQFVCSVNTNNYLGAALAADLLAGHRCNPLIHINAPVAPEIPAYGRIQGFQDFCEKNHLEYQIIFQEMGYSHESAQNCLRSVLERLENEYPGRKKGIFMSSDTYANVLLNLIVRKYGTLPEDYSIVGFDNSPVSKEAILPISTIDQQIDKLAWEAVRLLVELITERKKGKPAPLKEPVHITVDPIVLKRETTERGF